MRVAAALLLLASLALGLFLPRLRIEAGTNVLLDETDPDLAFYNLTRPDWGYDEYALVGARREDWFAPESAALLGRLAADLKKIPHVRDVTSILSVPLLRNPGAPLLPPITFLDRPKADLEAARRELLEHTQVRGNLLSGDGRDVLLIVHLDVPPEMLRLEPEWAAAQGKGDRERIDALRPEYEAALDALKTRREAMVRELRRVAGEWSARLGEPVRLSGLPIITVNLVEHVEEDLRTFGLAAGAIFLLAFAAAYRRVGWTLLPILACLLPPVLITGAMALSGKRMTVVTSNLPVLLFVLTLPYAVYFIERRRERGASAAAREIFLPCLFSAVTTMAGFASFMTSGINPVRSFGLLMTVGMIAAPAAALVFLPAISGRLRPLPPAGVSPSGPVGAMARLVVAVPGAVVATGVLILGLSAWGITRLRVETKFIDYFRPESEVYRGLEYIDTRMGGTTPLEVILTAPEPGFFKTDAGIESIRAAARYFDAVPEAGSVRSLATLLDEVRKAPLFRRMKPAALGKLDSVKGLVREFVDEDFSTARILVRFRETAPTLHRNRILAGLRAHLAGRAGGEARPTGIFLLYANMLNTLVESQKETALVVLGAIYAMLVLLFRSPRLAAVILLPQALPAAACLGFMGWTGIPLDLVTVMVTSVALGVGIDAAIQYAFRYRSELAAAGGDRRAAVARAHATIGRSIWIATSVVTAGFAVLALSRFVPTASFGLLTALAMLLGQFAALTLLPALFLLTRVPR